MKKYEWLLLDLDNTLLDFDKAALAAFQHLLDKFEIPSQPHYYTLYKKINRQVWTAYENKELSAVELRTKRFELFLDKIEKQRNPIELSKTFLALLVEHSTWIEGAQAFLEAILPHYKMAIITNGLKEVQRPRLHLKNMNRYFEAIIVSDEIGFAKPAKAYFDYVFNSIKHPQKSKVLVIGDSLNSDIKGGNDFGLDTCWFNPKQLTNPSDIKPTFEIGALEDLQAAGIL